MKFSHLFSLALLGTASAAVVAIPDVNNDDDVAADPAQSTSKSSTTSTSTNMSITLASMTTSLSFGGSVASPGSFATYYTFKTTLSLSQMVPKPTGSPLGIAPGMGRGSGSGGSDVHPGHAALRSSIIAGGGFNGGMSRDSAGTLAFNPAAARTAWPHAVTARPMGPSEPMITLSNNRV